MSGSDQPETAGTETKDIVGKDGERLTPNAARGEVAAASEPVADAAAEKATGTELISARLSSIFHAL